MSPKKQTCVFCSDREADTRDHVPGKQFFPGPSPANRITVPSCGECNAKLKPHEDYVRMLFSVGPASDTPLGYDVWKKTTEPSLAKDRGLARLLARNIEPVDIRSPAGLFMGTKPGVRVNWDRVFLVVEKCVRGLYYHETETILPRDVEFIRGGIHEHNQDALKWVLDRTNPGTWKAPGVFQYKWNVYPETPGGSLWAMTFYNTHAFIAITDASESQPG